MATSDLCLLRTADDAGLAVDSIIYRFESSQNQFVQQQAVATIGARDVESFRIGAQTYLAIANSDDGLNTISSKDQNSVIYRWDTSSKLFVVHQNIATHKGSDFEFVETGGSYFLAVANGYQMGYAVNSIIYRWNTASSQWVQHQLVATFGASDWESFSIAGKTFLAVGNYYDGTTYAQNSPIFEHDSGGSGLFVQKAVLPTLGCKKLTAVSISSNASSPQIYIATANLQGRFLNNGALRVNRNVNSTIFSFDAHSYEVQPWQTIPTFGATGITAFDITGAPMLLISNSFDSVSNTEAIKSKVLVWSPAYTVGAYTASDSLLQTLPFLIDVAKMKPAVINLAMQNALTKGEQNIRVAAFSECGTISVASAPGLPSGLSLELSGGRIYIVGSPLSITAARSYSITATNAVGSATGSLSLSVNDVAPANLVYSTIVNHLTVGRALGSVSSPIIYPTISGGSATFYTLSPSSLPSGLSFSSSTGTITGTPQVLAPLATYIVSAANTGGVITGQLSIGVSPDPEATAAMSFSYPNLASPQHPVGQPVRITPVCEGCGGGQYSFRVLPALPDGLQLNATSGAIDGAPTIQTVLLTYLVVVTTPQLGVANTSLELEVVSASTETNAVSSTDDGGLGSGAIAGIVLAVVGFAAAVAAVSVWVNANLFAPSTQSKTDADHPSAEGREELELEKNQVAKSEVDGEEDGDIDEVDDEKELPSSPWSSPHSMGLVAGGAIATELRARYMTAELEKGHVADDAPTPAVALPPSYRTALRHSNSLAPPSPPGKARAKPHVKMEAADVAPLEEWSGEELADYLDGLGDGFGTYANEARACGMTGGMVVVYDSMEALLDDLEVEEEDHRDTIVLALAPLMEDAVDRGADNLV